MTNSRSTPLTARRSGPLQGRIRVPGDKSISHRALILAAMTVGESTVSGLLEGADVIHTADAMRALGARVERTGEGVWRIHGVGVGGFAQPARRARFRQFRHRLPAGAWRGGRLPDHRDLRRRRVAAQTADAPRARSAGENGRAGDRCRRRRPAAADAAGRRRSDADRLRIAGAVGATQVGGAAGRPRRRRRDDGDRSGGDPRPYRADAEAFRRQGGEQGLMATMAAVSPCRASRNCRRPMWWCRPIRHRRRFRWSAR